MRSALAGILVTGICLAACSDAQQATPEATPNGELAVVAADGGHEYSDTVREGMIHVIFDNRGSTIHEAMFIKLPEGMTGEQYLEEVRGGTDFPEGALDYSGPGLTSPGERTEVWLELDPGNYILACWFRGHLLDDPVQPLIVLEGRGHRPRVEPPRADVTLKLLDYRYELDGDLRPGPQVLRVETPGPSMHEFDIFLLDEGKTVGELWEWYDGGRVGPPPARALGGVLDNHDIDRVVWLRTVLPPGQYVLWCNVPLATGGGSHSDAGMFHRFTIAPEAD